MANMLSHLLVSLILASCCCLSLAAKGEGGSKADLRQRHVADEVIVKFVAGASEDDKGKALGKNKEKKADRKETLDSSNGELMVVKLKGKSVQDAINDIGADNKVVSASVQAPADAMALNLICICSYHESGTASSALPCLCASCHWYHMSLLLSMEI
jgi:hypothetical protein